MKILGRFPLMLRELRELTICGVAPKFHSKFSQKFENRDFENFGLKMTKIMLVSGPLNNFGIQRQFSAAVTLYKKLSSDKFIWSWLKKPLEFLERGYVIVIL